MSGVGERRLTGREALDLAASVVRDHGGSFDAWLGVCRLAWERVEAKEAASLRPDLKVGYEGEIWQRRIGL